MRHQRADQTDLAIERDVSRSIDRRRFLQALAATPILYGLLTSCGSRADVTVQGPNDARNKSGNTDVQSLRSDKPRAEGSDPTLAAAAINSFGNDLLGLLTADVNGTNGNVVCSPASIAIALAMTLGGAAGGTRTEMASVLHAGGSTGNNAVSDAEIDAFHSSMNSLLVALSERNQADEDRSGSDESPDEVQLDLANSMWGQVGFNWEPAFLDLLAEQYGAGLEVVDFAGDPAGATKAINTWVADATHDHITDLIADGQLSDRARFVLANAVYLKATWQHRFDPISTYDRDFTTGSGEVVSVPTMGLNEQLRAVETESWAAVELPYAFNELSLVVAVGPDPDSAGAPQLEDVLDQTLMRDVVLSLPKFDLDNRFSLVEMLKQLGMPNAFGAGADFSAMTTDDSLFISEVVHQATITVDEDGTEASAATAVMGPTGAAPGEEPPPPLIIDVDKPFTFWLRDQPTGAVIFTGRVNDPRQ